MKRFISAIAAIGLTLLPSAVFAQSSAQPVLPGTLTTSGCTAGVTTCYIPYSASNPLPVTTSPTADATAGVTPVVAGSSASSAVLKAAAGNLYSAYVTTGATQGWLMVFNATALPSNGATTAGTASGNMQECIYAPANTTTAISFNPGPAEPYTIGITAAFSSTGCGTLTASATAFIHGSAK